MNTRTLHNGAGALAAPRRGSKYLRRAAALALLALAAALSSCAPVASAIVEVIENSDGGTLTYVTGGLEFDPGPATAVGVIVRVDGLDLGILSTPPGGTCSMKDEQVDCRLGDVTEPVMIGITGGSVIANATWRRDGSSKLYLTTAQAREE